MFRYGEFPIDFVLDKIEYTNVRIPISLNDNTLYVKMNSQRYHLFKKQLFCNSCGLTGVKFCLETSEKNSIYPHFNLYAEENENEVLMTKDHIIPKSKGGKNNLKNYVTMCSVCNFLKDNKNITYDQVCILRKFWNTNITQIGKKELISKIETLRLDLEQCNLNQKEK